jgi:hypothetical protein
MKKLTNEMIVEIIRCRQEGYTWLEIQHDFGVDWKEARKSISKYYHNPKKPIGRPPKYKVKIVYQTPWWNWIIIATLVVTVYFSLLKQGLTWTI